MYDWQQSIISDVGCFARLGGVLSVIPKPYKTRLLQNAIYHNPFSIDCLAAMC